MKEFEAKSLVILGRQPALGLAELESLYGAGHIQPLGGGALLDVTADEINFKRLGGTLKVARLLHTLPTAKWPDIYNYLAKNIPKHLQHMSQGTFTLGVSIYGLGISVKKLRADLLALKKIIRSSGRSVRIVPNKTLELNAAQVLHNKLTSRGAWELLVFKDGKRTLLAQTLFVQDIEGYAARDQTRPRRDARVGMLPPKLAQIIINLAAGAVTVGPSRQQAAASRVRVLDPFCGTGTILQEALLMGYHVIGTDIDTKMVEYSISNIQWLIKKHPDLETQVVIETGDATRYQWPRFSVVASELYLGRPLSSLPLPDKLQEIVNDVNVITKKFLQNLAIQMKSGQRAALAAPAWRTPKGFIHLPLIDHLTDMGYNRIGFVHVKNDDLVYFREDQVVARELIVLEKT